MTYTFCTKGSIEQIGKLEQDSEFDDFGFEIYLRDPTHIQDIKQDERIVTIHNPKVVDAENHYFTLADYGDVGKTSENVLKEMLEKATQENIPKLVVHADVAEVSFNKKDCQDEQNLVANRIVEAYSSIYPRHSCNHVTLCLENNPLSSFELSLGKSVLVSPSDFYNIRNQIRSKGKIQVPIQSVIDIEHVYRSSFLLILENQIKEMLSDKEPNRSLTYGPNPQGELSTIKEIEDLISRTLFSNRGYYKEKAERHLEDYIESLLPHVKTFHVCGFDMFQDRCYDEQGNFWFPGAHLPPFFEGEISGIKITDQVDHIRYLKQLRGLLNNFNFILEFNQRVEYDHKKQTLKSKLHFEDILLQNPH